MDGVYCEICQNLYREETCVPRVLKCGNSICSVCIENLLDAEKDCPKCNGKLSKSLQDYPINLSILKFAESLNKGFCIHMHDTCSLEMNTNVLLVKRDVLEKSIEKRLSLKMETENYIRKIKEMKEKEKDFLYKNNVRELTSEIESHIKKVDEILYCGCTPDSNNFLYLSEYSNNKHFLYDLAVRVQNKESIYVCDVIANLGWKCGKLSFRNSRLHVHILSENITADSTLVLLQDIRKCLFEIENILPFIQVGSEEMIFSLTGESSIATTLLLIKFFTGESGLELKDTKVVVSDYLSIEMKSSLHPSQTSLGSYNLNSCVIEVSSSQSGCGYEHAFHVEANPMKLNENDIILQVLLGSIHIRKIESHMVDKDYFDVTAKLDEDCEVNFKNMLNQKVEDCGFSFFV